MTRAQLRGYYALSEALVPQLEQDPQERAHWRTTVFTPMMLVGKHLMQMPSGSPPPSHEDLWVTRQFLARCEALGAPLASFTRSNGEVIR